MNTVQITACLREIKLFGGVFPIDLIPQPTRKPVGFVINTHDSRKQGEHWVAIVLLEDNSAEYFDSFGFPPLHSRIQKYLAPHSTRGLIYSSATLQHPASATCGAYCIEFLKHRSQGLKYNQFLAIYSRNLRANDSLVSKLLNKKHDIQCNCLDNVSCVCLGRHTRIRTAGKFLSARTRHSL